MDNLFQYFMYKLFGRRWIMYMIREGSKQAIFAMALDVEQYFDKLKEADAEVYRTGQLLDSTPKTGLSADGQKKLDDAQLDFDNAKMNLDLVSSEYNRRAQELVRARERLAHVLKTKVSDIESKYAL